MLRSKDLYQKKCKDCNLIFRTNNENATVCPSCKQKAQREYQKAYRESHKKELKEYREKFKKIKTKTQTLEAIPLREYTAIIENYNKKHKTKYTYGQFTLLLYLGKIFLKEWYLLPQYYGSEKTKCPFYKDETKNSIRCEGVFSKTTNQNFENSTQKKEHKTEYCDKDYSKCHHYKNVNEK